MASNVPNDVPLSNFCHLVATKTSPLVIKNIAVGFRVQKDNIFFHSRYVNILDSETGPQALFSIP